MESKTKSDLYGFDFGWLLQRIDKECVILFQCHDTGKSNHFYGS